MPSYRGLLVVLALAGMGSGLFHPEAARAAYLAGGTKRRGADQAVFQVGGNMGQAFGPLAVSGLAATAGLRALPLILVLGGVAVLLLVRVLPWYRGALQNAANRARTLPRVPPSRIPLRSVGSPHPIGHRALMVPSGNRRLPPVSLRRPAYVAEPG